MAAALILFDQHSLKAAHFLNTIKENWDLHIIHFGIVTSSLASCFLLAANSDTDASVTTISRTMHCTVVSSMSILCNARTKQKQARSTSLITKKKPQRIINLQQFHIYLPFTLSSVATERNLATFSGSFSSVFVQKLSLPKYFQKPFERNMKVNFAQWVNPESL